MRLILKSILISAVWFILLAMGLFEDFEKKHVFFPTRAIESTPDAVGLSYEDAFIKTSDGLVLHGWHLRYPRSKGVLLFFHGNAGNVSHRLNDLIMFHQMGRSVLIIDYRGYGHSQGEPSEEGTYLDALASYRYLRDEQGYTNIVVFGRSLGAAVAIDLCTKVSVAGLISESAFASVEKMAKAAYPLLPVTWMITMRYDNLSKVATLKMPKLFLHSKEDEMVPFKQGLAVYQAALQPKEFFQMHGIHNEGRYQNPGYRETIKGFLEKVLKGS